MDKEECTIRCEQLIGSAPQSLLSSNSDESIVDIHRWSSEVVYFLAGILPKGHPMLKHVDQVLKSKFPSNKLAEILGAVQGFKSSLDAGDLDYLFVSPIGFVG